MIRLSTKIKSLTTSSLIALAIFAPVRASAAQLKYCQESVGGFLGFPTWYKYLNPSFNGTECSISFDIKEDIPQVLMAVFEIVLRLGGIVAVGFIIFGGFQYILSQGNPDQTKNARGTIINALIGLAISISSVAIVNLIGNTL